MAECLPDFREEAAVRDAQQGDRDGRAPPFSGAKSARLTFPPPRGAPPCADFGRNGGAHLRWGLLVCEAAAAGAFAHCRARVAIRWGARQSRCRRKLLCGTRSRATGTVALPLS